MARARAPEALTDLEQIRGGPELGTLVLSITYHILQSTYHISFPPIATYQSTYHLHLSRLQNRIIPPVRLSHPKGRLSRQVDYLTPKTDYHARSIITRGRLSDHHNNEFINLHKIVLPNRQETRVWIWANSKLPVKLP